MSSLSALALLAALAVAPAQGAERTRAAEVDEDSAITDPVLQIDDVEITRAGDQAPEPDADIDAD